MLYEVITVGGLVGAHRFEQRDFRGIESRFGRKGRFEKDLFDPGRAVAVRDLGLGVPTAFRAQGDEVIEDLVFLQPRVHFQHAAEGAGEVGEKFEMGDVVLFAKRDDPRITSYNVCYTKLLRRRGNLLDRRLQGAAGQERAGQRRAAAARPRPGYLAASARPPVDPRRHHDGQAEGARERLAGRGETLRNNFV